MVAMLLRTYSGTKTQSRQRKPRPDQPFPIGYRHPQFVSVTDFAHELLGADARRDDGKSNHIPGQAIIRPEVSLDRSAPWRRTKENR